MGNDPSPGLGCDVHKASIAVAMVGKEHIGVITCGM
jgi:hypothetical protein